MKAKKTGYVVSVYLPQWLGDRLLAYPDINVSRVCQHSLMGEVHKRDLEPNRAMRKWSERLEAVRE